MLSRAAGVALLAGAWFSPRLAFGYCRTTTCDVTREACSRDELGCATEGLLLSWPSGCIPVRVEGGSQLRGIAMADVTEAANNALGTWTQAKCLHGTVPSLMFDVAPAESAVEARNGTSAVRFRDEDWPYHDLDANVALTTLTVDKITGNILDADVELNSFSKPFFSGGTLTKYDLELVLLHEMGHVLGLGHSGVDRSRMSAKYAEPSHGLRWLSDDDERGVCATYPPARSPQCLASVTRVSLCDTLEDCRWVALVLLSLCWGVFGVLWRYRYRVCGPSARKAVFRPLGG